MTDSYGDFARFYDSVPIYRDRKDVDFYVERAKAAGGPVLELGCGSGRILVPTARAGVSIVGLDASPGMLALCRERVDAPLVCADMRNFSLGKKFALITIPFRPFQHLLDVEDQMACLGAIRSHLVSGGALVFDVFDPDLKKIAAEESALVLEFSFSLPDARQVQRSFRRLEHDRARQVQKLEFVHEILETGEKFSAVIFMRYFFRYELEHLLARCGFQVEQVYGDFDGRPVGPGTPELIFVTRKA